MVNQSGNRNEKGVCGTQKKPSAGVTDGLWKEWKDSLGLSGFFLHLNDAERNAGSQFSVNGEVNGVVAGLFKAQTLEVHDQVAGEEGCAFRESRYREVDLDGHAFLVQSVTVSVNDAQAKFVGAFVFRSKADAQGYGADRMYDRELTRYQRIKTALDAKLALIISCEVTKSRN